MGLRLSKKETVDILNAFTINLESAASIAQRYGVTRQGIHKLLHRNGVETPKRSAMKVSCAACGKEIVRHKCEIRKRKNLFCSVECYYAFLDASQNGQYKYWRNGQRIARSVVSKRFPLKPGYVVHHIDRNTYNNTIQNLMVFANQGDHVRYHRLGPDHVTPLFDGRTVHAY